MELKKPRPSRLVGGVETQNRLVSYSHVVDKNSEGISQEQGVPAPHQDPQPRVPVPGREVPTTSGWGKKKKKKRWSRERNFWSPKQFLLKNPHTDLLRLTPSEFQC